MAVKKIEIQTGIGLNMFFPEVHTLVFEEDDTKNPKFKKDNASFADPYKSVSKSAKNKKAKL